MKLKIKDMFECWCLLLQFFTDCIFTALFAENSQNSQNKHLPNTHNTCISRSNSIVMDTSVSLSGLMPTSPAPLIPRESFTTPSLVETRDNIMSPPILVNREESNSPSYPPVTDETIGFPSLVSLKEPRTESPFQLSARTRHRSRDSAYGFDFLL